MTQRQANLLKPGVYRLRWHKGGDDLALIGQGLDGTAWYAAVGARAVRRYLPDRTHPMYLAGRTRWRLVESAIPVICVDVTS